MYPSFFKTLGPINIDVIKSIVDCELKNIAPKEDFSYFVGKNQLREGALTFLNNEELIDESVLENVTIICTKKKYQSIKSNQKFIIVKNVQEAVAKLSNLFYRDYSDEEISNFDKPTIGKNCQINQSAKIENGCIIGNNVHIGHGVFIGHNCIIGDYCRIDSNSVISNSILSERVKIGRNTSIGQNGFGFLINNGKNIDIFHHGKVMLESNVSVGSCCTIDRGSFDNTIIGENTYLDNLCHVAHNVQIGTNSVFAAMSGIAGSTKIGNFVLVGGQVGISGHLEIGNNVQVAAKSGVFNNINDDQSVMGNPAIHKYKFIKKYKQIYGKK